MSYHIATSDRVLDTLLHEPAHPYRRASDPGYIRPPKYPSLHLALRAKLLVCKHRIVALFLHHPHHYLTAAVLTIGLWFTGDMASAQVAWLYALGENLATSHEVYRG
jgi:hypothetical protein